VKAVNVSDANDVRVYENSTIAARLMHIIRREIDSHIGSEYKGYTWSILFPREMGTYGDEPAAPVEVVIVDESGTNGRCIGKVIARNLVTGEDIVYDSANKAAACNGMSAGALKTTFIDKARQANGLSFRSYAAKEVWAPAVYFKFKEVGFVKKGGTYIVSESENGEKVMYESVSEAVEITGIKQWNISQYMNSDKVVDGTTWRSALPEEYTTFVVATLEGGSLAPHGQYRAPASEIK
jgi:hypothetical protein